MPSRPEAPAQRYGPAGHVAALAALAALAAACRDEPVQTVLRGEIMGTSYLVRVVSAQTSAARREELAVAVRRELQSVDEKMSTYREDSELSRLNRAPAGVPVALSEDTFEVLRTSQEIGQLTGGVFDITVGPLVNAWGFGPGPRQGPPPPEAISGLLEATGSRLLDLDAGSRSAVKGADGLYCDLSAIAKGYAVDRVADALRRLGERDFLIELGGEIHVQGCSQSGRPWRVAVEGPTVARRSVQRTVELTAGGLATSGDYRNFYEDDGRRYSHTIDPRTGRPVTHALASATVVHESSALADAFATALMVLGPDDGYAFARQHDLAALLLVYNGEGDTVELLTPAFEGLLEPVPCTPQDETP